MIEEKIFEIHLVDESKTSLHKYFPASEIDEAMNNCYQAFPGCTIYSIELVGKGYRPTTKTITIEV